ncbi:Zn-ribbon domain-containing OB-fold protein [Acuticoccus mangrovi]|uniref:OB-fold domain-containing protein n=1 Tax=Acuticoccus mangrovi TaxID=2796142 RepID=A0A934IRT1_9HYPH|nr:OB-fold domain-containing protein [Acuticoccus mangrovi]MBJ3777067.1 OB-fold domain-containing protein [Acuticoccus mangrovi]
MGKTTPVMSLSDAPMWQSIENGKLALMACKTCGTYRYPPSPICPKCLSMETEWKPIAGTGTILSWVVFHRKYFDDFPPPYNAVAVRLDEGPIIMTNLVGEEPEGSWIGKRVSLEYVDHDGRRQHAARIAE